MRFLIIVKACAEPEADTPPDEGLMAAMAEFHAALARDGALLDAAGLRPSAEGWRIHYDETGPRMETGPFDEPGQLATGYTLIEARSRDEALEWTQRFPQPQGSGRPMQIEVRPLQIPADPRPGLTVEQPGQPGLKA